MDPFNITNFGLIFSRSYSYRGGNRIRARITRAVHALVVVSMLLPGGAVTAAPAAVQDVPSAESQVEGATSTKPSQNPEYSPRPSSDLIPAASSGTKSFKNRTLSKQTYRIPCWRMPPG